MISDALIRDLPKTDLHVHLDGSLRIETLIDLARQHKVELPSYTAEGLNELVFKPSYADLGEYLRGFAYTCAVLRDPESLERAAYELALDCIAEGVRYLEVRFAPQLHINREMHAEAVLQAVWRGLDRAEREHRNAPAVLLNGEPPFRSGIIVCAMRMFAPAFSWYYKHVTGVLQEMEFPIIASNASLQLARSSVRIRDEFGIPIVGFDLAGQEHGYPPADHAAAYQYAHEHFMKKTVHAGEAYGPESIFQAITALYADRIGHGCNLFDADMVASRNVADPKRYVTDLARYIADRRITIEVCITSNMQTNPLITDVRQHAFGKMLDARLSCTFCTDNRLVSHTTVSHEIRQAIDAFDLNLYQVRNLIIYGFKRSFFPGDYNEKRRYVRHVIDYFDAVVKAHDMSEEGEGISPDGD